MWGNKTREREREILLICFRKVQKRSKSTFPTKENTSQHQICPTEIYLVFHAKTVALSSLLLPRFPCPQSVVWIVPYGPKTANRNRNLPRNLCPKLLVFRAKSILLYGIIRTVRIRTVWPPTTEKYFGQKFTENFFSRIVPSFLKKRALFVVHFPLLNFQTVFSLFLGLFSHCPKQPTNLNFTHSENLPLRK
jgi:hypothetical protein